MNWRTKDTNDTKDTRLIQRSRSFILLVSILLLATSVYCQSITTSLPEKIDHTAKYIFYLHGGIIQEQGENAVSPYYGPYEFRKILSALKANGFNVISEVRQKGTREVDYAQKVSMQIDTLVQNQVPSKNITVVGASLGAYITIELVHIRKDANINYALLGLCSEYAVELYSKYADELCGNFLSIYEASDEKGSCRDILNNRTCKSGFQELELHMGIGHGFLYKPYDDWMKPLLEWIDKS